MPELLLELGEQVGVGGLAAAAGAEDRADERGHRDHVVDGGRRLVDAVRLQVGVDAVGVGLGVADDLLALLAVGLDEQVALLGDERLGLRRWARTTGRWSPGEKASMSGTSATAARAGPRPSWSSSPRSRAVDPAGAEGDVGAGLAVDVRDPVGVVDQLQAGPAGVLLVGVADRREVLGQVEVVDVRLA